MTDLHGTWTQTDGLFEGLDGTIVVALLIAYLTQVVVGFRLVGELAEGATATDLVLTVTQMLREKGTRGRSRRSSLWRAIA